MKVGPARPNLFRVSIPNAPNNAGFGANNYLKFFCKMATIPSVSHELLAANGHERLGVVRQTPTAVVYGKPFSITVIERSDFLVYNNIREWFDLTCPAANAAQVNSHRMNYYNNYVCDIKLTKLEYAKNASDYESLVNSITRGDVTPDGYETPLTVKFKNAYPTSIGDISLSSEIQNGMVEFNIDFNYEVYETVSEDTDNDD